MGHQFPRAVVAAAVAFTFTACGGSDGDGEPPPVLDIARGQVEDSLDEATPGGTDPDASSDGTSDAAPERGSEDAPAVPEELPAPDPSTFEGANRVVNLWVGAEGATSPIDVWGRRTFNSGPVLLAENIGFGETSDYFAAPPGYRLVIVGSGAGPDGDERAGLFNAVDGEQITTVFTNDDDLGAVTAPNLFERGSEQSPEPPVEGVGLVWLYAPNIRAFSDDLIASVGGDAFYVGDGSPDCRPQRIEATGGDAHILGGTQQVELELSPGPVTISLHPWFSPDECDQPAALEFTVDVAADVTTIVLVYSPDGTDLATMTLPVADLE